MTISLSKALIWMVNIVVSYESCTGSSSLEFHAGVYGFRQLQALNCMYMSRRKKIPVHFYRRENLLQIARDLLGKQLVTRLDGMETAGRIVEVEAYAGISDKASHAFGGRRTARNEVMYAEGGLAYIYLCYGIHHLVNVVTHRGGVPHAILIRALEPLKGTDLMLKRTGKPKLDYSLTRGPGNLSLAMGLNRSHNGLSLSGPILFLADDGYSYPPGLLGCSPRIGVDYAGDDAFLPYRFYIKGNPYVSGKPK